MFDHAHIPCGDLNTATTVSPRPKDLSWVGQNPNYIYKHSAPRVNFH